MWRLVIAFILSLYALFPSESRAEELFVCGWDEVFVLEVGGEPPKKTWTWRASDRPELPERFQQLFRTTDDCKPVDGGKKVLVSASSGGLALVERPSGQVSWYGYVGNAHSIELLPGERVAVAGSTNEEGNRLAIFDLKEFNKPLYAEELYSGHGVIWDQEREWLWALGYETLKAYRLNDWLTAEPSLIQTAAVALPDTGGHDLYPVPGTRDLIVTTNRHVYLFDRDQREFRPHPELNEEERVKGVSVHPKTGRVAYVQAEGLNWWASQILFLNPSGSLQLSDEKIYKVRWSHR